MTRFVPIIALAVAIVVAYGGAVANGFVWDDIFFIQDLQRTNTFAEKLQFALKPLLVSDSYVRPLPLLTFYIDYHLFGTNAAGWHAVALFLHLLNSYLVTLIAQSAARYIGRSTRGAMGIGLLAGLVFALHPALTENVLWISSRFDLLATLFMLAGIHLATRLSGQWSRALAVSSCFLLAALSKESAIVFPLVISIFLSLRGELPSLSRSFLQQHLSSPNIKLYGLMVIAGIIYLVIRAYSLNHFPPSGAAPSPNMFSWLEVLIRSSTALTGYVQLTLVPFVGNALHHPFTYSPDRILQGHLPEVVLAASILTLIAVLAIRKHSIGWVLIAWLVAYAPVLQLLPILIGDSILQQRFMYLPTALLLSFFVFGVQHIRSRSSSFRYVVLPAALFLLICTVSIRSVVPMWSNNLTLWTWARTVTPGSSHVLSQLTYAYLVRGMHDRIDTLSETLFAAGAKTDPMVPAYVGISHFNRSDYEASLFYLNLAHKSLTPKVTKRQISGIRSTMALAHAMTGDSVAARHWIEQSLEADSTNFRAIGVLTAMCGTGQIDETRFRDMDVRDAAPHALATRNLLSTRRLDTSESDDLCPTAYSRRINL